MEKFTFLSVTDLPAGHRASAVIIWLILDQSTKFVAFLNRREVDTYISEKNLLAGTM
jgi:hypothetical protein